MMKNIFIAVLIVLTALFGVFGYMQKLEADAQREIAVQLETEAEKQKEMAENHRMVAGYAQHRAEELRKKAEEALAECQKSKR